MSLIKSSMTVGGLTMVSRVLGFIRDILLARFLGAGMAADAFFVAFKLPNLFRRLFAEGAFSAAFVPLFSQNLEEGHDKARRFAEDVLASLLPILLLFTALVEAGMPWVILALTGGFHDAGPEKFELAVDLTRLTFPFLALISLVSLMGGVLNGLGKFAAAAAAPILLNIFMISTLVLFHDGEAQTALSLATAVTLSGLAQFIWLLVICYKNGMRLYLRFPRLSDEVKTMLVIMAPAAIGAGAMQLNVLIDTILASRFLPEGSISYLYFGDRLNQLPIGVIGVAVGTVLLPTLARQIKRDEKHVAIHSQNRAIEFALFLTLPAALGLITIPDEILRVLFERGSFDALATQKSAAALGAYALGLPAYVLIKTLTPGFFARKDTKTPVRIAIFAVITNSVLGIILMLFLAHVGLALATAISAWLNAGLLYAVLHRRGHFHIDETLRKRLPRMALSGAVMVPVLWGLTNLLGSWLGAGGALAIVALALMIVAAVAVYGLCTLLFGALALSDLKAFTKRSA